MGYSFLYSCSKCNYTCEICGGVEGGMDGLLLETFSCDDCKSLNDIKIRDCVEYYNVPVEQTYFQKLFKKPIKYKTEFKIQEDLSIDKLCCSDCKSKNIKRWNGNCPKCNTIMNNEGLATLWD